MHLFGISKFFPDYDQLIRIRSLPVVIPIAQTSLMGSIYCTVAMALERFFAVCHPFLPRRWAPHLNNTFIFISILGEYPNGLIQTIFCFYLVDIAHSKLNAMPKLLQLVS